MEIKSTFLLEYYVGVESELFVVRDEEKSSHVFLHSDDFLEFLRSLPEKKNG